MKRETAEIKELVGRATCMDHGSANWCHFCGLRTTPLADIWVLDNAEAEEEKTGQARYFRICLDCAVALPYRVRAFKVDSQGIEDLQGVGFPRQPKVCSEVQINEARASKESIIPGESDLDWLVREFEIVSKAKVSMASDYGRESRYGDGWSDSLQILKTLQRRLSDAQRVADERCKPFPGSETGCGCIEKMDALLAGRNTKLDLAFTFRGHRLALDGNTNPEGARLMVATTKVDSKVLGKPVALFPPFCPFCGRRCEEEKGEGE